MAHILFTAEASHIQYAELDDAIENLGLELRKEFPAFYVADSVKADRAVALVIGNLGDVPDGAWERLDGWGHGDLTLELVK